MNKKKQSSKKKEIIQEEIKQILDKVEDNKETSEFKLENKKKEIKKDDKVKVVNLSKRNFVLSNNIILKSGEAKEIFKSDFNKIKSFQGIKEID